MTTVNDILGFIKDKWVSFGDVNYLEYGGVQLKWDENNVVEFFDWTTIDNTGDAWFATEGAIWIDDLVANKEELDDQYGSTPNWAIEDMELSEHGNSIARYGDAEDINENPEKLIWLLTAAPSYGGFSGDTTTIFPQDIANRITKETGIKVSAEDVAKDNITNEQFEQFEDLGLDFSELVNSILMEYLPKDLEGLED